AVHGGGERHGLRARARFDGVDDAACEVPDPQAAGLAFAGSERVAEVHVEAFPPAFGRLVGGGNGVPAVVDEQHRGEVVFHVGHTGVVVVAGEDHVFAAGVQTLVEFEQFAVVARPDTRGGAHAELLGDHAGRGQAALHVGV